MTRWIKARKATLINVMSTLTGLLLISAAAFTVAVGLGLLVSGLAVLLAGYYFEREAS